MSLTDYVIMPGADYQSICDAVRSKNGETGVYKSGELKAAIKGITGDNGYAELIYETEFTIAETNLTSTKVTVAEINTGLKESDATEFYAVIKCINDADEDISYNHIHIRTQNLVVMDSGYCSNQVSSGMIISDLYNQYGSDFGIFISYVGRYLSSLTIKTQYSSNSFGGAPKGDYNLKLFRLKCKEVA